MSQKVVQSILAVARDEKIGRAEGLGEFVAQLFAWCKLSCDQSLPDDISIWNVLEVNEPKGFLSHAFSELEHDKSLSGNGAAFKLDKSLFESISHSFIIRAIETLKSANENKVIKCEEVLPAAISHDKRGPEAPLSKGLILLMRELAGIKPGDSVYCPFDETFSLAKACSQKTKSVYCETLRETRIPYLLNLFEGTSIAHQTGNIIYSPSWVEDGTLTMFDRSLVNPPFGMKYSKEFTDWFERFPFKTYYGEALQIWHALAQTKKRAVVLVPHSILARTSGGEKDFKKQLIEDGLIEAIIDLPPAIMHPFTMQVALLVLNKAKNEEVLFINATKPVYDKELDFYHDLDIDLVSEILESRKTGTLSNLVSQEECSANDYNLLVNRYVMSKEQRVVQGFLARQKTVPLGEIAELIRPQAVKDKDEEEGGTGFHEVMVGDLPKTGYVEKTERDVIVSEKNLRRAKQQQLSASDILVSVKGTIGKIGFLPEAFVDDKPWLAGQSLQIVRCKEKFPLISPVVLYMYLKSPIAQSLLSSLASGTIAMVQVRDIKALPVPIPTVEEQHIIIETFNEQLKLKRQIVDLEAELGNLAKKHWKLDGNWSTTKD